MSYTSSNFNLSFSNSNGTAEPGNYLYFLKNYTYKSQGPISYRLNMPLPLNQYPEIIPIPFVFNFEQEKDVFNLSLTDALKRFQEINHGVVFNISKIDDFLKILKKVCVAMELQPYIMFNKFATKIELSFNEKKFTLDYDYEDMDNLFIMSSLDGTIIVKECTLDKMEETLGSF